jgi:hypothetical protein
MEVSKVEAVEERDDAPRVEYCDACSRVCDDRCRSDTVLGTTRDKVAELGFRL